MAQFKKNIFGSSYFGYTTTLSGVYTTSPIDADEPFTGTVDVKIEATLPIVTYDFKHEEWVYEKKTDWLFVSSYAQTNGTSKTDFYLTAKTVAFSFIQNASNGSAKIQLVNPRNGAVLKEATVNTTTSASATLTMDIYDVCIARVIPLSGRIQFTGIQASVTDFAVEVSGATTLVDGGNWTTFVKVPLTLSDGKWVGSSPVFTAKRFVKARFHLATSDDDVTPSIHRMEISSGDMSKRAEDGWWKCAIDLREDAKNKGKVFKAIKRLEWKQQTPTGTNIDIRSSSVSSGTTFPNNLQVRDETNTYWKAETAPYVMEWLAGYPYGRAYSRISLKPTVTEGKTFSWRIEPLSYGIANTSLEKWVRWKDQSYHPTDNAGSVLGFGLYRSQNLQTAESPIFRIENPGIESNRTFALVEEYNKQPFYVLSTLKRLNVSKASPVLDYLDFDADVLYETASGSGWRTDTISALDNETGIKKLQDITTASHNWPTEVQYLPYNEESIKGAKREIELQYSSSYPRQIQLYFKGLEKEESKTKNSFYYPTIVSDSIYSKAVADEPTVSTGPAPKDRLVFHYLMDGGSIQYPLETKKELGTDFTPDLLTNETYQYHLQNGWPDEFLLVPFAMSFKEAAEFFGVNEEELKQENPHVALYNGLISKGVTLKMPNKSKNEKVSVKFSSTGNFLTLKSHWNNNGNDEIVGWIPSIGEYGYQEWVSEEILYEGLFNPNDKKSHYVRKQRIGTGEKEVVHKVKTGDTYEKLATQYNVLVEDIRLRNHSKELVVGENVLIPLQIVLPALNPEAIFEVENPYVAELVPQSLMKTDGRILDDTYFVYGIAEVPPLSYTKKESTSITVELTRGSLKHGKDVLFHSNVKRILSVVNKTTGYVYQPYNKSGTVETGDYKLTGSFVDWETRHASSKEPNPGEKYTVTYTYETIDTLTLSFSTSYFEKNGVDRLWRSQDVKEVSGICTPEEDVWIPIPSFSSFEGYSGLVKDPTYVVEDNDLWVKTKAIERDGVWYLYGTMNGEDPKRNWYPRITPGYYYIGDTPYYLFKETRIEVFGKEEVPVLKYDYYKDGALFLQKPSTNLVKGSKPVTKNRGITFKL